MNQTDTPEGEAQRSPENSIMDDLTTMNDTCQKPGCMADSTDTYHDEHGNELDLCERHYYELVSGEKASTGPTTPFLPQQDLPNQTAEVPTTLSDGLEEPFPEVRTQRRRGGTRDLHPSVDHDDDE